MTATASTRSNYQREDPGLWHTKHPLRIGYFPKWRDHQITPYQNIDPDALVRQAKEMGATVFEWGIPENHVYIEWEGVKPHPHIGQYKGDLLADLCAAGRKHGVKILLCYPTNGGHEAMHAWRAADAETVEKTGITMEQSAGLNNHICINYKRFRDWSAGYVRELARRYDIDGLFFDGPWFKHQHVWPRHPDGSVACELCFDAYKTATGREVPPAKDWASPEFRQYVRYFKDLYAGYLKWMTGVVKDVDPNLFVSYNSPVYVWGGWGDTCPWDHANECSDVFFFEMQICSREELQPILQLKLNRAALHGRAPETYCKTFDLSIANFVYSQPPLCEVAGLGYLTLSEGAIVGIHSSMDENGRAHPERTDVYTEFGRQLQPKLPYFTDAAPFEHVGVHLSERTRDVYAGENTSQYLASPVGAMQILAESQMTYGVVLDRSMSDAAALKRHPVLVLANSASMTEAEAEAIRQYVADGGCLLATGETSLYDEHDQFRGQFLLEDVLGVRFAGPSPRLKLVETTPSFARWPFLLRSHALTEGLQDRMITNGPWYDVTAADDREVVATWAELRPDTDFCCVNGGMEITGDSGAPAIVAGQYGQGRVVYCAADLTGRYMFEMNRHIRGLVGSMLTWLGPPPVVADTPSHVHFAVTAQPRESRLILHMVNILYRGKSANEILGHGFPYGSQAALKRLGIAPPARSGRPETPDDLAGIIADYRTKHRRYEADHTCGGRDGMYPFDEVIPLLDLRLRIDASAWPFTRAVDIDTGDELTYTEADGMRDIVVDRLDLYKGIALDVPASCMPSNCRDEHRPFTY